MRDVKGLNVHRLFYPSVPAVLSTSHNKTISAMPVVSFTTLSDSPPLLGVSSLPSHFTHKTVLLSKRFSLCWLDRTDLQGLEFLASHSGRESEDKLRAAGLKHHRGSRLEVPVIDSAVAVLECSLARTLKFGDHEFLIGRVEAAYATEDFREYWEFKKYTPILYTGSRDHLTTLEKLHG